VRLGRDIGFHPSVAPTNAQMHATGSTRQAAIPGEAGPAPGCYPCLGSAASLASRWDPDLALAGRIREGGGQTCWRDIGASRCPLAWPAAVAGRRGHGACMQRRDGPAGGISRAITVHSASVKSLGWCRQAGRGVLPCPWECLVLHNIFTFGATFVGCTLLYPLAVRENSG